MQSSTVSNVKEQTEFLEKDLWASIPPTHLAKTRVQQEQNILSFLDKMPSYILHQQPTKLQWFFSDPDWFFPSSVISFVGVAALGGFLSFVPLMFFSIPFLITMVGVCAYQHNKVRVPNTSKEAVDHRKLKLSEMAQRVQDGVLKKRLTDLYFLCDSPSLDRRFWIDLKNSFDQYDKALLQAQNDEMMLQMKNSLTQGL